MVGWGNISRTISLRRTHTPRGTTPIPPKVSIICLICFVAFQKKLIYPQIQSFNGILTVGNGLLKTYSIACAGIFEPSVLLAPAAHVSPSGTSTPSLTMSRLPAPSTSPSLTPIISKSNSETPSPTLSWTSSISPTPSITPTSSLTGEKIRNIHNLFLVVDSFCFLVNSFLLCFNFNSYFVILMISKKFEQNWFVPKELNLRAGPWKQSNCVTLTWRHASFHFTP
jgi:hypothetical protein